MNQPTLQPVEESSPTKTKKPARKARQKAKSREPNPSTKAKTTRSPLSTGNRSNGVEKKKNGNGNGHKRLTIAELTVAHAELVAQNTKLAAAVAAMTEELRTCHAYLDALQVPWPEKARLPDRVVAGAKRWFAKHGGIESSDHVSSALRGMLRDAGEWRCLYPGAYPDDVPKL